MKKAKKVINVFTGHTLEEYKSLYDIDKSIHIDKETIDKFYKKHPKAKKNVLLDGRSWWLIGDTYYEINPRIKATGVSKIKKSKAGMKIVTSCLLGTLCIGGVGTGTYYIVKKAFNIDRKQEERQIDVISDIAINHREETTSDEDLNIILSCVDTSKEVYSLNVSIGNKTLEVVNEFIFNAAKQTITIPKSILDDNKGNISINVVANGPARIHVTSMTLIESSISIKKGESIKFSDLPVRCHPEDAANKNLYVTCDDSNVIIDNVEKTIKCSTVGKYILNVYSEDYPQKDFVLNPTLNVTDKVLVIEEIKESAEDPAKLQNLDINNRSGVYFMLKLDGEPVDANSYQSGGKIDVSKVEGTTGKYVLKPDDSGKCGEANFSMLVYEGEGAEQQQYTVQMSVNIASYDGLDIQAINDEQYRVAASNTSLEGDIYLPTTYYSGTSFHDVVTIGTNAGNYDEYGFYETKITSIEIPSNDQGSKSINKIGDHTFEKCTNLKTAKITKEITSIGMSAFACLDNLGTTATGVLTDINLQDAIYLDSLGKYAFMGQKELTSIHIPSSVTSIGENCFKLCNNLATVTIDSPTIAKNFDTAASSSNLTDYATEMHISKNGINREEISPALISNWQQGTDTDNYFVYIKS